MKRLLFTVTNDLAYDQRMIRICSTLASAGYKVSLVGTKKNGSPPLMPMSFGQIRIYTWFKKGPGFYAEFNCRLFFFLLFAKTDLFCCIDLDTILPVWLASIIKRKPRVYDAHEYFSEQKEIVTRPGVYKIWHWIEKKFVPLFPDGYTVGNRIAAEFNRLYGVHYETIRNLPLLREETTPTGSTDKFILYQGAVNEARGLEYLVPAMNQVDGTLLIYGDGNLTDTIKKIIKTNNLSGKVFLKGKLLPSELEKVTASAHIGVNLVENIGLNQYYSLANKFFDYIHHLVPQVTMAYPEYMSINEQFEVALLVPDLEPPTIAASLNRLMSDTSLHQTLRQNCLKARTLLNWQEEEKKLLAFYGKILLK